MRRYYSPFNGRRYILNVNTSEVHNLELEQPACKIDEIKHDHIIACDSFEQACILAVMTGISKPNGCHHCLCEKDKG